MTFAYASADVLVCSVSSFVLNTLISVWYQSCLMEIVCLIFSSLCNIAVESAEWPLTWETWKKSRNLAVVGESLRNWDKSEKSWRITVCIVVDAKLTL